MNPITRTLGFLGPEGSHSAQAAHRVICWLRQGISQASLSSQTGHIASFEPYDMQERPTLERLMADCETGVLDWAVLPVENVLEGSVIEVISQMGLQQKRLTPLLEFTLSIEHCLMLPQNGALTSVKRVLSHPQALGQCRETLIKHLGPDIQWEWTSSTAEAARRLANDDFNPTLAAIGSEAAAHAFGLSIALPAISDHADNHTRFWLVSGATQTDTQPLKALCHDLPQKTSLCLAMRDRAGVLADVLTRFKAEGINLTKIESRPSRQNLGQYYFHLDAEGDLTQPSFQPLFDALREDTVYLHTLGAYPVVGRL